MRTLVKAHHRQNYPGVFSVVKIEKMKKMKDDVNRKNTLFLKQSESKIPLRIRGTDSGNYIATDFAGAGYVLIDIWDKASTTGTTTVDFYGSCVEVLLTSSANLTAVYYKVDQYLSPKSRSILGLLSRHFSGDDDFYYNDVLNIDNIVKPLLDEGRKVRYRHTVDSLESLPKPKISGDHHIHFTAAEVLQSCKLNKQGLEALRLPNDVSTSMMGGVMLWLRSLPSKLFDIVDKSGVLEVNSVLEFVKLGKKLSVRAKSYQNIVEEDLRMLFEVEVLANRAVGAVDWVGEKFNRTKPALAVMKDTWVYEQAKYLFGKRDETMRKPTRMTWKSFWASRWQWSASGSIHSQYAEDLKDLPKEQYLKNKFIALSMQPERDFDHFANRKPALHAWSSIKYEWGKQRAIYGTDLTSYIMAHFAFYNCEDCLPVQFPVGKKARPSFVRGRVNATLENAIPFCIDFEDFNSQHSIGSMKAVIQAYMDVHQEQLTEEQLVAMEWTKRSLDDTWILDNMGTKTQYAVKGTLMSGWRLTTFINSVLNYLYTKKILTGTNTNYRSVHNGDDVMLGCNNFELARVAVKNGMRNKIRLQRTKCSFGGLAEFLRVDHISGESGQYITRNISTLMHSRIESKMAVKAADIVEAMEERFSEFITRGGSREEVAKLRNIYYHRKSDIFGMTAEDLYDIKTMHRVVGGISERIDARTDILVKTDATRSEVELPDSLPGVAAYASQIEKTLDIGIPVNEIADRIQKATSQAVQLVRYNQKIEPNEQAQLYRRLANLYKAHADMEVPQSYGKAMLVGFALDLLQRTKGFNLLARMVRSSSDKMRFLTVVT
jgi:hypothetical protein